MNIYRINLNLLKVFVVLMREQQVSAAAKCLHLTQPAISNSLQQLRELFQDELLIRAPKKMVPTQKALLLAPQIDQALTQLESLIFYEDEFEYKVSTRTFHLGMRDYAEYGLLPKIYAEVKKIAPNVSLKIHPFDDFTAENFENEKLELGIGVEKKFPKQLMSERLFSDSPVCVAHVNHALFKRPLTLEAYLQAEHLAACVYSEELSRPDSALKKLNLKRNIKLTLPNVLPAFQMLATSNLVGTFSKSIVMQHEKKYQLKYAPPPFTIPGFHIAQIWHRQQNNDSGLIWLRSLIKNICKKYFSNII
ncbi:MAG TPA: LysR family transcriptional regulator [Gammaproteobacteria bacterium]|nr:LysR family transcriptional regulator [Gammaproteobacteria bacterium]